MNSRCLPSRAGWALTRCGTVGVYRGCPGAPRFQALKEELCSPDQITSEHSHSRRFVLFLRGSEPPRAELGTSWREVEAFGGNEMRLSRPQLTQGSAGSWPNPGICREHAVAAPAVCREGCQAPERRLTSPRVGLVVLPAGCRSLSTLPALCASSASAAASPTPRPVQRAPAPAPRAGRRWDPAELSMSPSLMLATPLGNAAAGSPPGAHFLLRCHPTWGNFQTGMRKF